MKLQHIALVCLLALSAGNVTAQMLHRPDSMYTFTDPRLPFIHSPILACKKNTLGVPLPKLSE